MTDGERSEYDDKMGRLAACAVRMRCDPDKLAAVKRIMTGNTRCPECDALNRADQRRCEKCGAKLYPGLKEDDEEAGNECSETTSSTKH